MSLEDEYAALLREEQRKAGVYLRLYLDLVSQLTRLIEQIGIMRNEEWRSSFDLMRYMCEMVLKIANGAIDRLERFDQ